MEYFFFTDKKKNKYNFLKKFTSQPTIKLQDIQDSTQMSITNIRRLMSELNNELTTIFPNEEMSITPEKNSYTINFNDVPKSFVLNSLKLFYVKQSNEFFILNKLLNKQYASVNQLSFEISISSSHLYKYLKNIREFLKQFNLSIRFAYHKTEQSNLVGDEVDKIYFLNTYYWHIYMGIEDPSFVTANHPAIDITTTNPFHRKRLQYILAIAYLPTIKKCDIDLSSDFISLTRLLDEYNPADLAVLLKTTEPHLRLLDSYNCRLFIPDFDSDIIKIKFAKQALLLNSNKIVMAAKIYLDTLLTTYSVHPDDSQYNTFLYYSLIIHGFLDSMNSDFFPYFDSLSKISELTNDTLSFETLEYELRLFHHRLLDENKDYQMTISDNNMSSMAKFSLLILDQCSASQALNIYITFSKNNFSTQMLKKNLVEIFGQGNINLVNNSEEADIIFSDFYQSGMNKSKLYFFDEPYSETAWSQANAFIISKMYQKRNVIHQILTIANQHHQHETT